MGSAKDRIVSFTGYGEIEKKRFLERSTQVNINQRPPLLEFRYEPRYLSEVRLRSKKAVTRILLLSLMDDTKSSTPLEVFGSLPAFMDRQPNWTCLASHGEYLHNLPIPPLSLTTNETAFQIGQLSQFIQRRIQ